MKPRTMVLAFLVVLAAAGVCLADDPMMGTWKLNEAKSKLGPGATKNNTVVYEASFDSVKVTVDGTDSKGQATHSEGTGKFDGKDYPVTGDSTASTRTYRRINDHAIRLPKSWMARSPLRAESLFRPTAKAAQSPRLRPMRRA
jgi:hypothetical protein